MRYILAVIAFFMGMVHGCQTGKIDHVDVLWRGIYTSDTVGSRDLPGSPSGKRKIGENYKTILMTRSIPMKLGTQFGMKYIVAGEPQGSRARIKIVILFPQKGLRNPANPKTFYRQEYEVWKTIGEETYTGYGFDHDWELVPGPWIYQVWDGNRK